MGNFESRENFLHFNMKDLNVDEAYLIINSSLSSNQSLDLFELSSDCIECAPTQIGSIKSYFITKIGTKFKTTFFLLRNSTYEICSMSPSVGEFGIYEWQVETDSECAWETIKEHDNIYWPLLFAVLFYVLLGIAFFTANFVFKKFRKTTFKDEEEDIKAKKRLRSIDSFRGFSITLMIFVNMGGGGYFFFEHATWDGFLIADLVFPCFLWIMGVCIPISIRSVLRSTSSIKTSFFKILKRSVYLFLLGLMLGAGTKLETLRIFGVLQRFSLTYFIVANICLLLSFWFERDFKNTIIRDVARLFPHWIIIIIMIIIHTTITFCLPVPGCPTGYLGPGGDHLNRSFPNCTGGSSGFVDRMVLGAAHLYSGSTIKDVYHTYLTFDPEGIIGTITSCVQVFLGVQAGSILLSFPIAKHRILRWFLWAIIYGIFGIILCKGTLSDGWIPINKNLWSMSFVFVTSSLSFLILTLFYYVIDVKKWWSGSPFYYPGMNAIVLYCGHMIAWNAFPLVWKFQDSNTHALQLVMHLWTTTAWVLVSVWLYRIKFFLAL